MKAVRLRTDYRKNPIGIGNTAPEFSWNCEGGRVQTAYQLIVRNKDGIIWDSGKVQTDRMTHIRYAGKPLTSRERVHWSVMLWDENGSEETSDAAFFELGLLSDADWSAQWIAGDYAPKKNTRYPVDYFERKFTVSGTVIRARLYATARGVYQAVLNGKRVEDFILAPGMTDYRKRIQYQTYDVTSFLGPDTENALQFKLGDGWFRGSVAAYGVTNVFGTETSLCAQLELTYDDGRTETIVTDDSFRWSNDGPLRFADLKDGEQYDARRTPTFQGKAKIVAPPRNVQIVASENVPVREKEEFRPTELIAKDGTRVLDFGQNLAGYLSFWVKGRGGSKLKLTCGEVLNENGRVDLSGVQEEIPAKGWSQMRLVGKLLGKPVKGEATVTPKQEIRFLCSGDSDHYKTSFAIFGFRYVEIHAEDSVVLNPEDVRAIAVYSDMEETGDFTCSNPLINRLVENTRWSMKSNFLELPTDCPTRERLGWTGDAQIFFNTGAYFMDTAAFFKKWLTDLKDNQYGNGVLSAVVPYQGVEMMYKATGGSVGWADAVYLIPYRYYLRYGDLAVLKGSWEMMKRYTDYLLMHLGPKDKKEAKNDPDSAYLYEKGVHLGEWLEPEEFRDAVYGAKAKHPEEGTAYLYLTMKTMRTIAKLLKEDAYAEKLKPYEEGARRVYLEHFIRTGTYHTKRQAKLVRPLALGLMDGDNEKKAIEDALVSAVEEYGYRVGTGFLSTPFLLPALTKLGRSDLAYRVLENEERPGWLAEVKDGATTVWESWEGDLSQNHYSPGAVCEWLFDTAAGIRIEGESKFLIAPIPGGTLTEAKGSYLSPYGRVVSSWKRTADGTYQYEITVPPNTTAEVRLPDGRAETVGAGTHTFT